MNSTITFGVIFLMLAIAVCACDDSTAESQVPADTATHDSDSSDSASSATEKDMPYCEWQGTQISLGSNASFDLPPCLGCNNYVLVSCDDIDSDGVAAPVPMESDCACLPESCVPQDVVKEMYVGTAYLSSANQCCTCSSSTLDPGNSAWAGLECTDGPCGDGSTTCEYNGVQYQPGEFGPAFPCDSDVNGCLCEVSAGLASWKCMQCSNSQLPEVNQSAPIGGHCCTHLKFGSPAYDSSYLQCVPGSCP